MAIFLLRKFRIKTLLEKNSSEQSPNSVGDQPYHTKVQDVFSGRRIFGNDQNVTEYLGFMCGSFRDPVFKSTLILRHVEALK